MCIICIVITGPKGIKFFIDHEETAAKTSTTPYATLSPQALGEGKHTTKTEELKYDYARTGPILVRRFI